MKSLSIAILTTLAVFCRPGSAFPNESRAPATEVAEPGFGPLPAFKFQKDSKVEDRALVRRMNRYMAGQRVMAVGYGESREDVPWSDEAFAREPSVIGKLQMVCAKESARDKDLIPFKVGSTYVVAPEMRDQANPDLSRYSEFELASRGLLLDQVLLAIPESQLAALASDDGIAVSSLPEDARPALMRAFRPPLKLLFFGTSIHTGENGLQDLVTDTEDRGRLEKPIDWSSARLRARLHLPFAMVDVEPYAAMLPNRTEGLTFEYVANPQRTYMDEGMDMPVYSRVPNTYKPSDLDGKSLTQPLNAAGIFTAEGIAKRLEASTGLRLSIWQPFRDQPVFIGSNSVTAGEVIDGLRLGLTGAWRKLGSTYVLAYDKIGIQAVQRLATESAGAAAKAIRKRKKEADESPNWIRFVDTLPFDRADPLQLTSEQRKGLFVGPVTVKEGRPRNDHIDFQEMTPEQQAWVRSQARYAPVSLPGEEGKPDVTRPMTDADIQNAYISGYINVDAAIWVPGTGWVRPPYDGDRNSIGSASIRKARAKLAESARNQPHDSMADVSSEIRLFTQYPKPFTLPSPLRAVMVPPLGGARLIELAEEMKRHGLNLLFYPVLFDGYAPFESKAFPLHPDLHGSDGWEAAREAMAKNGIEVAGYLRTLAWRDAGSKAHYLTKHPDWIDVDVVGRTRGRWYDMHPEAIAKDAASGVIPSDYVRAAEPAVSLKLRTLIDEFAKKPGSTGLCFLEWQPDSPQMGLMGMAWLHTPRLGYGVPDRIAALGRTGIDPVDRIISWDDFVPPSLNIDRWDYVNSQIADDKPPQSTLIADLVERARSARKDWKIWLDESYYADATASNEQDALGGKVDMIAGMYGAMMFETKKQSILLPITPTNPLAAQAGEELGSDDDIPADILKMPAIATYGRILSLRDPDATMDNISSIILDFRTAPQEITPSLQWIKPPGKAPAPGKPRESGVRAPK